MAVTQPEPVEGLSEELLTQTAYWIREFSMDLHREMPMKLHSTTHEGHGLVFHPEFIGYIERPCRREHCFDLACTHGMRTDNPPQRARAARAFRRLRRDAPREFDVLWMMCVHGTTLSASAASLNARAIRLDKPERFGAAEILLLVIAGIHKLQTYYD